jgi:hypothetical protein
MFNEFPYQICCNVLFYQTILALIVAKGARGSVLYLKVDKIA